jgi:hypothetical protein
MTTTSSIAFEPADFDYSTSNNAIMDFDCAAAAASFGASSVSSPQVRAVDVRTNLPVAMVNEPAVVDDTTVRYQLDGSLFERGGTYRVEFTFEANGSTVTLFANAHLLF